MHEEAFKIRMNPWSQTLRPVDFRVMFRLLTRVPLLARYPLCNHSKRLLFQTKPSCGLHENPLPEELTSAQHQCSRSSSRHILQKCLSSAAARRPYDSGFLPYFESNVVAVKAAVKCRNHGGSALCWNPQTCFAFPDKDWLTSTISVVR